MTKRLGTLLALILTAGCEAPTAPGERDDLASARALWEHSGPASYSYEVDRSCFCVLGGRRMLVTVTNGSVSYAQYLDSGSAVDQALLTYVPTVADLFDLIQDALGKKAAYFAASYDPTYGYPTRIEVDYSANTVDDEVALTARDLIPVAR